jgi:hypothetical protein
MALGHWGNGPLAPNHLVGLHEWGEEMALGHWGHGPLAPNFLVGSHEWGAEWTMGQLANGQRGNWSLAKKKMADGPWGKGNWPLVPNHVDLLWGAKMAVGQMGNWPLAPNHGLAFHEKAPWRRPCHWP